MRMRRFLSTLAWLAILISILLSIIFALAFDRGFYQAEYQKYDQAETIRMRDEDLMKATDTLLDYLEDQRDDILVEAEVNGVNREVFNERETLHMVDVKNLYQNALKARWILLGGGLILMIVLMVRKGEEKIPVFKDGFRCALGLLVLFLAFIGIWAIADFDAFWVDFHYLFFDNDLFFLDPAVSIMINMFPGNFFFDLVIRIIVVYVTVIVILALLMHHIGHKNEKELQK
jgi:integral membrane protein (TIGR01906 family)